MFKCIKYSYKTGDTAKRTIDIKDNVIAYRGTWTSNAVDINEIRGIAYGPRTITFNMVKECIPWLIVSIITADRTYDFEFKTLHSLKRFISAMHLVNRNRNHNMVIPQLEHIDMDNLWMRFNHNANILKMFQNPKWSSWLNNRNRKYRIVRSKNMTTSHNDHDTSCSICLDECQDNDFVCQLICGHAFHIECISEWFKTSFTCPLCRVSIS
jgi:hypothetical protein